MHKLGGEIVHILLFKGMKRHKEGNEKEMVLTLAARLPLQILRLNMEQSSHLKEVGLLDNEVCDESQPHSFIHHLSRTTPTNKERRMDLMLAHQPMELGVAHNG